MSTENTSISTEITSETIGERLATYRKSRGKSQRQISMLIGVSRSYWGDIESGRCRPSRAFIEALLTGSDVNTNWLLTGKGAMRRKEYWLDLPEHMKEQKAIQGQDSLPDSNRTSSDSELFIESDVSIENDQNISHLNESDKLRSVRAECPIRIGRKALDFLAELTELTPEQQIQVLEFIREKRRLNDLEAKISALTVRHE